MRFVRLTMANRGLMQAERAVLGSPIMDTAVLGFAQGC